MPTDSYEWEKYKCWQQNSLFAIMHLDTDMADRNP